MTLTRTCCCDDEPYYVLEPCYFTTVAAKKYMSAAAFASCGFDQKSIYKNTYCGFFRNSATTGDTLDNTCANYTENAAGCCGGPFDPCPDNTACCGLDDCLTYREANSLSVPLTLTGYVANTGSAGSSWTVSVQSVSTGTPAFDNAGTGDFKYSVSVELLVTFDNAASGTISCDNQSTPQDVTVTLTFNVDHDVLATSACLDIDADETGTTCSRSEAVCTGTTRPPKAGYTACDIMQASLDSAGPTLNSTLPDFGNDCTPPGSAYSLSVPIDMDLLANSGDPLGCVSGCTGSGWASAYFPDVNATLTLTIVGTWT